MRSPAAAFVFFALLVVPAGAARAQLDYSDTTPFTRQVRLHLAEWDTDHDGALSPSEIDARALDPLVTGDAAAALCALKVGLRRAANRPEKSAPVPRIDRAYLDAYGKWAHSRPRRAAGRPPAPSLAPPAAEGAEAPDTTVAEFPDFDRMYRAGMTRLRRGANSGDIFGPDDPRFERIKQGTTGDCYLLAVLGGLVKRDPAQVRRMVATQPDGAVDVTFPSGRAVRLPRMTDTERILYGSGGGEGTRWLTLIEDAYGRLRNENLPEEKRKTLASDLVVAGGSPRRTLGAVTGHETGGLTFPRRGADKPIPTAEEAARYLPKLRDAVRAATKDCRLMVAGTGTAPRPPGITGKHAYAVLSYDEATDTVRVWNPHRNDFTPTGPAGVENGYPTRGGVFDVPLADIPRIFSSVSWELDRPAASVPAGRPGG